MEKQSKHENYEILNLIGYGLAKFNMDFVKHFGFQTKTAFYEYIVRLKIADTIGTVKNRQDLFDHFFDNGRKGWWQKGNTYIHRKILIDSLFESLTAQEFASIVQFYIQGDSNVVAHVDVAVSPLMQTKFRQMQVTGQAAELFFMNNFNTVDFFRGGILEDARNFGDGYDFQIERQQHFFLAEIKGMRAASGSIRMTEKEFHKAKEYKNNYALVVVSKLEDVPNMNVIFNPTQKVGFTRRIVESDQVTYHSQSLHWP